MTLTDDQSPPKALASVSIFALAIFVSAALVFTVEPIVGKLMLPLLGGGPSIWNTSLAFFQGMLLLGYAYAHLLQKIPSLKFQTRIHIGLLVMAALTLPLQVSKLVGQPNTDHPVLWLLAALTCSVGAPFAVLSATAPLVQAWFARTAQSEAGPEPYALYAASNIGSLLALLAYPLVIEPLTPLHAQTWGWCVGYLGFVILFWVLTFHVNRAPAQALPIHEPVSTAPSWGERGLWVILAAIPSSLMLGVTSYITTNIASAPFLWVIPLALYLSTFILAFSSRQFLSQDGVLTFQAAAIVACIAFVAFVPNNLVLSLLAHLSCFFLTALVCHQALVARRPPPEHLTEFYLWMLVGGVVGGGFNAFLAPVIFNDVWEYPLVLVVSCLARPWGHGPFLRWRWITLGIGVVAALSFPVFRRVEIQFGGSTMGMFRIVDPNFALLIPRIGIATALVCAFVLRRRAQLFVVMALAIAISTQVSGLTSESQNRWRSFFGVLKESHMHVPQLGGDVIMLVHGTTLHGAQAQAPKFRCRPLVYYAPETPIGQVFTRLEQTKGALRMGAIGLGAGTVASYVRPGDKLTFFEIDPLVVKVATDPKRFTYISQCATGPIDYVIGDARLTLARQPKYLFDILLVDAFSSDSVPVHLMTVEAVRGYLSHIKPDGVVVMHLSNRNVDLIGPAMAVARRAGGIAKVQSHVIDPKAPALWESSEDALIIARNRSALDAFAGDPRWGPTNPFLVEPWRDDYTNLVGAIFAKARQKASTL